MFQVHLTVILFLLLKVLSLVIGSDLIHYLGWKMSPHVATVPRWRFCC